MKLDLNMVNSTVTNLIIVVLGIASLIGILDFSGFLPDCVRNWFRLNRAEDTLKVLRSLGIDIDKYRRQNNALNFPSALDNKTIQETTKKEINKRMIAKPISVGHQRVTKLQYYYDIIGGTCDFVTAEYFAKILSTYWSVVSSDKEVVNNPFFDFIVTPKEGSPLLGYEFARLCNKPLLLHEGSPRFNDNLDDMRRWFDCNQIPKKGSTALLVDDSITGGSMMEKAAVHLREYGYKVDTCLVVFEVCVKNGRQRLKNKDITLVEVVKTHTN